MAKFICAYESIPIPYKCVNIYLQLVDNGSTANLLCKS